jgi:hypothetical protein
MPANACRHEKPEAYSLEYVENVFWLRRRRCLQIVCAAEWLLLRSDSHVLLRGNDIIMPWIWLCSCRIV